MNRTSISGTILAFALLALNTHGGMLPVQEQPSRRMTGIVTGQVGFAPDDPKQGFLLLGIGTTPSSDSFSLEGSMGKTAYRGRLSYRDTLWDRKIWTLDFSSVRDTGTFRLTSGTWQSQPFRISPKVWGDVDTRPWFERFLARQRMTPQEYPGTDHLPTFLSVEKIDLPGTHAAGYGWQDAHSEDQYIGHAAYTLQLLWSWGIDSVRLRKQSPDPTRPLVLDEARWGLRFALLMQNPTGSFAASVTPPQSAADPRPRSVGMDSSTNLTALAAATLANGARTFAAIDGPFSDSCLAAARRGWTWALTHPQALPALEEFRLVGSDVFLAAALELWKATGETVYRDSLESWILASGIDNSESWQPYWKIDLPLNQKGWFAMRNVGTSTLFPVLGFYRPESSPAARARIDSIVGFSRRWYRTNQTVYGTIPAQAWVSWFGGNGTLAGLSGPLALAGTLLGDTVLLHYAQEQFHALTGRNPMGKSYIRGVGADWWRGEWMGDDTASSAGAVYPGILLSSPDGKEPLLPTDNCAVGHDMASQGWMCGEWCTGYTMAALLTVAALDHQELGANSVGFTESGHDRSSRPGLRLRQGRFLALPSVAVSEAQLVLQDAAGRMLWSADAASKGKDGLRWTIPENLHGLVMARAQWDGGSSSAVLVLSP